MTWSIVNGCYRIVTMKKVESPLRVSVGTKRDMAGFGRDVEGTKWERILHDPAWVMTLSKQVVSAGTGPASSPGPAGTSPI